VAGGAAEQGAERGMAGAAAVEAKDERVEIGLEVLACCFRLKAPSPASTGPSDADRAGTGRRAKCRLRPSAVYDKASAKGDGIIKEAIGGETLATRLAELWPADRAHLPVAEIAEWFATYVYLPKLRDRVVPETALRDALAKLDPRSAPMPTASTRRPVGTPGSSGKRRSVGGADPVVQTLSLPDPNPQPQRFFGSVVIIGALMVVLAIVGCLYYERTRGHIATT
jgi:hypothetical protein